ncbi:MAG TPA: hypothetical protein VFW03_26550 [Gemmatimonadaceae bacterium]|nr:hypothetical protein [Gemmatimonadaceae bacterium]
MIVRVWFRKGGASDGRWWTAQLDGEEWHCAAVSFLVAAKTGWESDASRPRAEQRHFIEASATRATWDGPNLIVS